MSQLDLVAFDADDTLWHNLIHFEAAEQAFGEVSVVRHRPQAEAIPGNNHGVTAAHAVNAGEGFAPGVHR